MTDVEFNLDNIMPLESLPVKYFIGILPPDNTNTTAEKEQLDQMLFNQLALAT